MTDGDPLERARAEDQAALQRLRDEGVEIFDSVEDLVAHANSLIVESETCACGHPGHVGRCTGTSDTLDKEYGLPPGEPCACTGTKWQVTKAVDVSIVVEAVNRDEAMGLTDGLWAPLERAIRASWDGREGFISDSIVDENDPDNERVDDVLFSGFFDGVEVEPYAS